MQHELLSKTHLQSYTIQHQQRSLISLLDPYDNTVLEQKKKKKKFFGGHFTAQGPCDTRNLQTETHHVLLTAFSQQTSDRHFSACNTMASIAIAAGQQGPR